MKIWIILGIMILLIIIRYIHKETSYPWGENEYKIGFVTSGGILFFDCKYGQLQIWVDLSKELTKKYLDPLIYDRMRCHVNKSKLNSANHDYQKVNK